MIDTCPLCFDKLMPSMIFKDGFMCDMCGAYAEDLNKEDIIKLQNKIDQHESRSTKVAPMAALDSPKV